MLESKMAVKHSTFCFSKCSMKKSLRTLKFVLKWCKLTTMGRKTTGKWKWVCMRLSKWTHSEHSLLKLGMKGRCKVHCSVTLCPTKLNCQSLGHSKSTNIWGKWFTMKKRRKSKWRVKRRLKCCHKMCKSMIVLIKGGKSHKKKQPS